MKKIALIALPAALLLAGCGKDPAALYGDAQRDFAAHDFAAARLGLTSALAQEPGNRAMLLLQARTLVALGDGEGARAVLVRLRSSEPLAAGLAGEAALLRRDAPGARAAVAALATAEAERIRALADLIERNRTGAGEHFVRGAALRPDARFLADYARYKLLLGDEPGARALSTQASRADPVALDPLLVAAQIALAGGDLNAALSTYSRAAKLYPGSLAALTGKAATLGDLGRTADMKAVTQRAAAFAPGDPTVMYLRARAAAADKDWPGVRALIQPAEATLDPLHPARTLYGEALLRLGQVELARAQLAPLVRAGGAAPVRLFAEAQLAGGDAAAALVTLKPLADLPTASREELALMTRIAKAANDPAAADYAQRSLFPAPAALARDLALGDAAIRASDWRGAITAYRRVMAATDGKNALLLNNLAYSEAMVGNLDEAGRIVQRALATAPDNPSVLDTAGVIRLRSGQVDKALTLLRRAAALAPANTSIRAHLAEAERART